MNYMIDNIVNRRNGPRLPYYYGSTVPTHNS